MKIAGGVLTIALIALFSLSDVNYVAAEREPECLYGDFPDGGYACIEILNPVCGTDDTTYSNECELCNAKLTIPDLIVKTDWQCPKDECKGATPNQKCTKDWDPVCASDDITAGNLCGFCERWARNQELYIKAREECGNQS
ncbi:serine protease inhibitor Kazal-type 1-like [Hyperolius riggenbachi]|uniref:serine protease inhibitor Kazal-type 1-like n=1 Tax=Hyperolius riggenbachi TaxID=752182 RepID=UPI0035A3AED6